MALRVAKQFGMVEALVKVGLRAGGVINAVFGSRTMHRVTGGVRRLLPSFPLWTTQLTGPVRVRANHPAAPEAVYFPTCITRMMGKDKEKKDSIAEVLLRLAGRAKMELLIPPGLSGSCCGQAFSSKGFVPAYRHTVNATIEKLWEWTSGGSIPVVIDITSCSHSLHTCRPYLTAENQVRFDGLKILDSLEFAVDVLLPRLAIKKMSGKAVFHPVCSLHKMGAYKKLEELAARTVDSPVIPFTAGCCGMAGDRGFYYPGLTASACREEGAEAAAQAASGYYSTGKTCEMALSEASGASYRSIFYLLDEVSSDVGAQ
jgi:D-lactate dehydrogenase